MTLDLGEGVDPALWAPSPDLYSVGGVSIWKTRSLVSQPNRWGVIQSNFPSMECTVEVDPVVAALLPMPQKVAGFVDRAHRRIDLPVAGEAGRSAMRLAQILAGRLEQIAGVRVAFRPFARTLVVVTPLEAATLSEECARRGLIGVRPLEGLGGGVSITVQPSFEDADLDTVAGVVGGALA